MRLKINTQIKAHKASLLTSTWALGADMSVIIRFHGIFALLEQRMSWKLLELTLQPERGAAASKCRLARGARRRRGASFHLVYSTTSPHTFIKTRRRYLAEDITSCFGCSGTAALCCSSGTAATPSDNKNTTARGNNTYFTLLLLDRPFPPSTLGGILTLTTTTAAKLKLNKPYYLLIVLNLPQNHLL